MRSYDNTWGMNLKTLLVISPTINSLKIIPSLTTVFSLPPFSKTRTVMFNKDVQMVTVINYCNKNSLRTIPYWPIESLWGDRKHDAMRAKVVHECTNAIILSTNEEEHSKYKESLSKYGKEFHEVIV